MKQRRIPVALILGLVLAAAPALGQKWTPEEHMKLKTIGGVQVSPDGRRVAYTVMQAVMEGEKSENNTQVWLANADGSDAFQLTAGEKNSTNPRWSPDGRWIAFTSNRETRNQIWLIRVAGGEAEQLTSGKSPAGAFAFSPDGRFLAYQMPDAPSDAEEKARKERNDARVLDDNFKMNHIWVIPVAKDAKGKREPRQITQGDFHVQGFDWSPDGKTIAFSHVRTPRVDDWPTADLSAVDVATGERKSLAASVTAENAPVYSPDGQWIAYSASRDKPTWAQDRVVRVMAATGGAPRTLADTPDNQANLVGWSADGSKLYFTETGRTASRIYALPVGGGAPVALDAGDGVIAGVNLNEARTHFGFVWSKPARPPEAYASAVSSFAPAQVSRSNEEWSKLPVGQTEVVKWKSKDGWEIEGLLTYPVGYQSGRRVPLLLVIHGGPAGVFTQSFLGARGAYPLASFSAAGYAVLRPNPRGSSGYGAKFRHANYQDWGGMDYQDLMTGVDHVIALGVADADRLGVMGWSYGGFMTSWVITQTKRFKAASIGAPVTNLMSFTGTTDIPSFVPDYFGAEFWDNPEIYQRHSAMFNIKGASTPSLIQHGEQDERVHIAQGMELYNALRRQGTPARMVTYPRMPHGVTEPRLQLDVMKRNLDWFAQYIKP